MSDDKPTFEDLARQAEQLRSQLPAKLADHPDERTLRREEVKAANTILQLARKTSRAIREHRRSDALVLAVQLAATSEFIRRALVQALRDQMAATPAGPEDVRS